MPAKYRYTCHNDRCPFLLERGKPFQMTGVPRSAAGGQSEHWHCPFCNSGVDTHYEPEVIGYVEHGQMTHHNEQPKIPASFRRTTRQVLPLR